MSDTQTLQLYKICLDLADDLNILVNIDQDWIVLKLQSGEYLISIKTVDGLFHYLRGRQDA